MASKFRLLEDNSGKNQQEVDFERIVQSTEKQNKGSKGDVHSTIIQTKIFYNSNQPTK
jgi:hypothetical protein